jgi:alpha-ketoglutarate-dependent taurine dioxygenase
LEEKLLHHGGLLFRGFGVRSEERFESFAAAICPELYGEYGDLPKADTGQIYEATPYPPEETILFHNESSHTDRWPMRQFFFCQQPAARGGETPVVDCRAIHRALPEEILEPFERLGLLYTRNFVEGMDVSWRQFFGTDDRSRVESYCRDNGIGWEWGDGDRLHISQKSPAVARHPDTGEAVFFNQIQLHHASCLPPEVRRAMVSAFGEDGLPRNVYYGDGSPIDDRTVARVLEIYWQQSVAFEWQQGDVLMVDNMLVAHARNPYVGPRRTLVALGRMINQEQLDAARRGAETAPVAG